MNNIYIYIQVENHEYCKDTMKMLLWLALVQMRFTILLVILKTSSTFRKQL